MTDYLCGIDLGTTMVKAGIFTCDGNLISHAFKEYKVKHPQASWVEQSVEEVWKSQCEVTRRILAESGIKNKDIAGVAIANQRATFALVNKKGDLLSDYIVWQDSRATEECKFIEKVIGNNEFYKITGMNITSIPVVSKILWLKRNIPRVYKEADKFLSMQNIHLSRFGVDNPPCDYSNASFFGLFDVDNKRWSNDLAAILKISLQKLPDIVPPGTIVGKVSKKGANDSGFIEGTPLISGAGDTQCISVGAGAVKPEIISINIGTGAGIVLYLDKPRRDPALSLMCQYNAARDAWEMEAMSLSAGSVYKWFRNNFGQVEIEAGKKLGLDPYELLDSEAEISPSGSNKLIFLPMFLGAGSPYWYSQAKGVMVGLTLDHKRSDLIRSIMEGIAFDIRTNLEIVREFVKVKEVRIVGGASISRLWNQIQADVYGIPLVKTECEDATLGSAILAGVGVGVFKNVTEGAERMVKLVERYNPRDDLHDKYTKLFKIYCKTFETLRDAHIYEMLANSQ